MPLTQVELPSTNKLGSLPGYVSSGDFQAGVIVVQEASRLINYTHFNLEEFDLIFATIELKWWGVNEQIKGLAERVRQFFTYFTAKKKKFLFYIDLKVVCRQICCSCA